MKTVDLGGTQRKIIAFNAENDLHKKPDSNFVSALEHNFPGTILGLRFYLEDEFLSKKILKGESDGKND